MSSFGSQMRKRLAELNKAGKDVPKIMMEVAEGATIEAVRVAAENTPPNGGAAIAGTNTRSGQLAQHWELDSQTKPIYSGGSVRTVLEMISSMHPMSMTDTGWISIMSPD